MDLAKLQEVSNKQAMEHGFTLGQLADPNILDFPFAMCLVVMSICEAVEHHRKHGAVLLSGNLMEEAALQKEKFRAKFQFEKLPPSKLYLLAKMLLIVTEAAEGMEAVLDLETDSPKTTQCLAAEEMADVIIRAIGLSADANNLAPEGQEAEGWDVARAVEEKTRYNASRPPRHGGKLY